MKYMNRFFYVFQLNINQLILKSESLGANNYLVGLIKIASRVEAGYLLVLVVW
jgi:hypothetical protein